MAHPLDLPEFIPLLTPFLSRKTLTLCLLVHSTWHKAFLPSLWQKTWLSLPHEPTDYAKYPTLQALEKHAHLVKTLTIHKPLSTVQHAQLVFPKLQSLILDLVSSESEYGPTRNLAAVDLEERASFQASFLERHVGTLRDLDIKSLSCQFSVREWKAIAQTAGWRSVRLVSVCMKTETMPFLWQTLNNSREVVLHGVRLAHLSQGEEGSLMPALPILAGTPPFLNLRKLVLHTIHGIALEDQLRIVGYCPGLQHLSWELRGLDRTQSTLMAQFSEKAQAGQWPDLESLVLDSIISDQDLARVIRSMRRITQFRTLDSQFGKEAFKALRTHFLTLEDLTIQKTIHDTATSPMVLEILESCPRLKILCADRLLGEDILTSGKPWACTSLERLTVYFDLEKTPQAKAFVFERLAPLKELTGIIGRRSSDRFGWGKLHTLDFRLECGLEKLEGLKKLAHLNLRRTTQRIGMEEAKWMVRHWQSLRVLQAPLNPDTAVAVEVQKYLRDAGVIVFQF